MQQNSRNGRNKNDRRYFDADHLIINRLTNVKILIDVKLNSTLVSIFAFIERSIIEFRLTILGHGYRWSTDHGETLSAVVFLDF